LLAFLLAVGVWNIRKRLMENKLRMEARVGIGEPSPGKDFLKIENSFITPVYILSTLLVLSLYNLAGSFAGTFRAIFTEFAGVRTVQRRRLFPDTGRYPSVSEFCQSGLRPRSPPLKFHVVHAPLEESYDGRDFARHFCSNRRPLRNRWLSAASTTASAPALQRSAPALSRMEVPSGGRSEHHGPCRCPKMHILTM
jgi:hypothetical protein